MLQAWRDLLIDLQRRHHCRGGCPIGSLAAELADVDEDARAALVTGFARWESAIRDGLAAMRERGRLLIGRSRCAGGLLRVGT